MNRFIQAPTFSQILISNCELLCLRTSALVSFGKPTDSKIASSVNKSIKVQNGKFAQAQEIAQADIDAIESNIELMRKQFPAWVRYALSMKALRIAFFQQMVWNPNFRLSQ